MADIAWMSEMILFRIAFKHSCLEMSYVFTYIFNTKNAYNRSNHEGAAVFSPGFAISW